MRPKRPKEWFDDDAFWRDTFPFMFSEELMGAAPEQVQGALELSGVVGGDALDLCCGPGRCSVALAQRGFQVTGVDRNRLFLDKARDLASEVGVEVAWVEADMRDFVRPAAYDLVLSMFTSFGYFEDAGDDVQVLANTLESLRPGGALVVELMGKEILAAIFQPASVDALPDGSRLVQQREVFDGWSRIRNEWTLIRDGRARTYTFHHSIYSGQELRARMEQVGFVDVRLYGDLEGGPYGPEAERLVAVGRKP